jgi:DNA-binding winged helix-turn-helix (wHTH) protein/TolB-like protein/Tfp pilus assembly protein PilF
MPEDNVYRFGPFRLNAGDRLLFRGGEMVPLPPKAIDTLLALVVNHGRVLEKDELLKTVWPDTCIEEGGLARNISMLRKALGGDEAEYIETIPKRGYRFIAEVHEGAAAPPARRNWKRPAAAAALAVLVATAGFLLWRAWQARRAAHAVRSIAVLPLKDLSNGEPYLAEGLGEVLTASLSKVRSLRVISSPAGRAPQTDAVLKGAVLRSAGRVRVTAQLVDARTGWLLWAGSYDRDLGDALALEAELAEAIAREVDVKLTEPERQSLATARASGPEASDAYLRGRYCWNRRTPESLQESIRFFNEAVRKDPKYAPAYAGLADAYALLGSNGYDAMPPREAMPLAKAAAAKALELDPGLAEARTTLAYVALAYDWDLEAAGAHFRAALDLNPSYATAHHWYGHYWLAAGNPGRAVAEMRRAQELQPVSLPIMAGLGWSYYFARDYDAAIAQFRKVIGMDPNFAVAHQTLGIVYQRKGLGAEAVAELERAVELSGASPSTVASLGAAAAAAGDRVRARVQLERLQAMRKTRYVPAVLLAMVSLALGDADAGTAWLRQGVEERSEYFMYAAADPAFEPLLKNPKAAALLQNFRRPL